MATSHRTWINVQKQLVPKLKQPGSDYQKNALRRQRVAIDTALKRGYLKYLDQKLILESQLDSRGKHECVTELEDVLKISLSGCNVQALDDITILSCVRLRICNLASCYISDITAFYGSVNLLKLDVSNNQIIHLPDSDFWSSLGCLRVLYLHGNAISERENITKLNSCRELHILTLHHTPLSLMKNYRHHVVNSILSLRALDQYVISDEEIVENLHLRGDFQPLSSNFRVQLYQSFQNTTSYQEEVRAVYGMLLEVDRVLARFSPVMIIERVVRGWLTRRALARSNNTKIRAFVSKRTGGVKGQNIPSLQSPRSLHSESNCRTILADVPSPYRKRDKGTAPPPPAPPTSPRRESRRVSAVETHVIGMDGKSSRLKYTMHINLRKLQQNISDADSSHELPDDLKKSFKSVFQRKSPRKGVVCHDKEKIKRIRGFDKKSPPKLNIPQPAQEPIAAGGVPAVQSKESDDCQIEVSGQAAQVLPHDALPDISVCKKEDGKMLREAEKELNKSVTKMKLPPPRREPDPNAISKEEFQFTRAYATMTLSTLRAAEKVHEARKRNNDLIRKANLVSKIKHDRVIRRGKIDEFQQTLRESNRDWKLSETEKLKQKRDKLQQRRKTELLQQSLMYDEAALNVQSQIEDQQFASKFSQQNTMVVNTLSKEDRRMSRENAASATRERVEMARMLSLEQQELVKKFMELRKSKLLQEGTSAKKELDTKMVEAVSHRLMEAKRKVAKEVARKQAARTTIALAKEEIRAGPHAPGESLPAPQGPPVKTDASDTIPHNSLRLPHDHTTPPYVRRMSRELHKTWQRGGVVLEESGRGDSGHFPLLPFREESAMMYDMMQPRMICSGGTDHESTSFSELTNSCPGSVTSSLLISRCQKVQ